MPFAFSVPQGAQLHFQELQIPPYVVRIYRPQLAAVESQSASLFKTPFREFSALIVPATVQNPGHVLVDGQPTVQANLFQIDFIKADFDRHRVSAEAQPPSSLGDPPITLAFEMMNNWLLRYKYLVRSSNVKTLRPDGTFWVLEYLTDQEQSLPADPALHRRRGGGPLKVQFDIVNDTVWNRVGQVPSAFKPLAWEILLLDAPALLAEIGPAVVLAYAALEAFIDWSLDQLAVTRQIPAVLWNWINTRDSFWLRPRTAEQFDVLLESVTGRTLKSDPKLWELFKNLASARHSYVHTGRASVGTEEVSQERATTLVNGAFEIINWVEALLPQELHRAKLETRFEVNIMVPIIRPEQPAARAETGS